MIIDHQNDFGGMDFVKFKQTELDSLVKFI